MNIDELKSIPEPLFEEVFQYVSNQKAIYRTKDLTARMLGISGGLMYSFLNKEWDKIKHETFMKIVSQMGGNMEWQVVETNNFRKISGAFNAAQTLSSMFALMGETGTGKTTAATTLSKKMSNVFYVLGDATMTRLSFMDSVLNAMGQRAYNYRSGSAKMSAICQLLKSFTKPLLVIDDCGKLRENVLQLIQIIYDHTRGQAGILLLGTETLFEVVTRHAENNKFHMREFYGRVGHWDLLSYPSSDDIKNICSENGITDDSAITWLNNATVSLHTLETMIKKAVEMAKVLNAPITGEMLAKINRKFRWHDTEFKNFEQRLKIKA